MVSSDQVTMVSSSWVFNFSFVFVSVDSFKISMVYFGLVPSVYILKGSFCPVLVISDS